MCTFLVTENVACLVSVGELAKFLMCTLLVTEAHISEGELAWFLMCNLVVTETVTYLISECELA